MSHSMLPYCLGAATVALVSGQFLSRRGIHHARAIMWFAWAVITLGYGLMIMLSDRSNVCADSTALLGVSLTAVLCAGRKRSCTRSLRPWASGTCSRCASAHDLDVALLKTAWPGPAHRAATHNAREGSRDQHRRVRVPPVRRPRPRPLRGGAVC